MTIYFLYGKRDKIDINKKKLIYFDNNATTQILDKDVENTIIKWLNCGNPSNTLHSYGLSANKHIDYCRHSIARKLHVNPNEIYFTSGATESNNLFIRGILNYYINLKTEGKYTIITSSFEHPSVHNIFLHYKNNPIFEIIFVDPCSDINNSFYGCIDPKDIEKVIKSATNKIILMSVMHGNNETGSIQNINMIGELAKKNNILFHTDVTQTIGKFIVHPKKYHISSLSFSGHKFHCPKGIGVMYVDNSVNFENLCFGGPQELNKRPGTENVSFISGITMALEKMHINRDEKNKKLLMMKKLILDKLEKHNIEIIGPYKKNSLPNTILIVFKNMKMCNKVLVQNLNEYNICVSVGSACQTGHQSHVITAMKVDPKYYNNMIRISLSDYNTFEECNYLCDTISLILENDN